MSNKEIHNAKDKELYNAKDKIPKKYYYISRLKISKKEKVFMRLIIQN